MVRRFDQPQRYKPFVSRCVVQGDDLEIGSVREVNVRSGLPSTTSKERLELLDDEEHIFGVKIVGGDHRLRTAFKPETCSVQHSLMPPLLIQMPSRAFLVWCGHTRSDGIRNEVIQEKVGVAPVTDKMRKARLRWFGHVRRRCVNAPVTSARGWL
ncbi:abscisic acid receptor PYL9-like [Solanum dulcamara]|uniref:abscisic acid receptor PYL9-like n=1 Tax=Solanum dulcamara TaxID=45834 RepID=UPI0024853140|nr:abscisic acid receptor PYL9-like [Solanum dulcamara]